MVSVSPALFEHVCAVDHELGSGAFLKVVLRRVAGHGDGCFEWGFSWSNVSETPGRHWIHGLASKTATWHGLGYTSTTEAFRVWSFRMRAVGLGL